MKTTRLIRIGSRKSQLALIQSEMVKKKIECSSNYTCEIVTFETKGDKILDHSLPAIGDKGLFTKELEEKLLSSSIDIAVHSLKDLPTELPNGLVLGAVAAREDVRDAFLSPNGANLEAVSKGGCVATGSLRRKVQLMRMRPDISIVDLRGNVPTRIEKMKKNGYDGIILAAAGLKRLGLAHTVSAFFDPSHMIPAAGQGAIGIEAKQDSPAIMPVLEIINDENAALETKIERRILRDLHGSCQVPIGINVRITDKRARIISFVSDLRAGNFIMEKAEGSLDKIDEMAASMLDRLVERGAMQIIEAVKQGGRNE